MITGQTSLGQDRLGSVAHQESAQSSPAVGAHHDRVAADLLGHPDNDVWGVSSAQPGLHGVFEVGPIDDLAGCLQGFAGFTRVQRRRHSGFRAHRERDNVQQDQPGAMIPGKRTRHAERGLGSGREVGGVKDDADLLAVARLWARPEGQHRTVGTVQHGDGHAPGQQPAQSGEPVRFPARSGRCRSPAPFAGFLSRRFPLASGTRRRSDACGM